MKLKGLFIKLERHFLYINFLFAALLLLSYLAAVISPQKFWPLAFLGLIYLMLLYINLFFVIFWAVRLKKYIFISMVSILLGYNVFLNSIGLNFFSNNTQMFSSATHLKLMTYNVHVFENMDKIPANKQILKVINSSQPDIIAFQEYYTQYLRFDIRDSLKRVLHTAQFYFEPFKITPYDSTGLAIYSKYPIVNKGVVRLSSEQNDNQGIYIDIKYQSRVVRIYCFHLKSLELSSGAYSKLDRFSRSGVIGYHGSKEIIKTLKTAFIIRGQQADMIHQQLAMCPYPYILLGDFNDTPASYTFNRISAGMTNAFREKGTGLENTVDEGFASFQIDYILTNKQFHIFNYQVIHKTISDHYPVYSEIGFN